MKNVITTISILLCLFMTGIADPAFSQNAEPGKPGVNGDKSDSPDLANDSKTQPIDLKSLLELAYSGNPQIRAARLEWQADLQMYPQSKALPDPSLTLKKPLDGSGNYDLEFMQMIPNPRYLSLRGKKALTMAEMAQVRFEKTVRDVLVDVMKSCYELGYLNQAEKVTKTNRDLFAQLVDLGKLRNAKGEIGASELYSAESRLAQAEYELNLLGELKEAEKASMRKLLGVDVDYPLEDFILPETVIVPLDKDSLRKAVTEHSQELAMAGLSVEVGNTDLSLARSMQIPDFNLGLMYSKMGSSMGTNDMGEPTSVGGGDDYTLMFGVTLPIWGGKNKAMVNEARDRKDAAEANYKNQQNTINEETDRLYWKILNLGRLDNLYKDNLLPQARNASQLAQTLYEQNNTEFSGLLETRMVVGNFEIAYARAQADYLQALADLSKLTGSPVWGNEKSTDSDPNTKKGGDAK